MSTGIIDFKTSSKLFELFELLKFECGFEF